jgi:hypothetical protein
MPTQIKLTKPLGNVVTSPVIRWPSNSRLSEDEKSAIAAYTKEVEQTIRRLAESVRELQTVVDGKTVGG